MVPRPPRSTRTDTPLPYTTLFLSCPCEGGVSPDIRYCTGAVNDHAVNAVNSQRRYRAEQSNAQEHAHCSLSFSPNFLSSTDLAALSTAPKRLSREIGRAHV